MNKFERKIEDVKKQLKAEMKDLKKNGYTETYYTQQEKEVEQLLQAYENELRGWTVIIFHYAAEHGIKEKYLLEATNLKGCSLYVNYSDEIIDVELFNRRFEFIERHKLLPLEPSLWRFHRCYIKLLELRRKFHVLKAKRFNYSFSA